MAEVQEELRIAAAPAPEAPASAEQPPEPAREQAAAADAAAYGFAWGKTLAALVVGAALTVAAAGLWVGRVDPAGIPWLGPMLERLAPTPPGLKVTVSGKVRTLASGQTILEVSGSIINPASESQAVPELEARLLGADGSERRWTISPAAVRLAPGAMTGFSGTITDVPGTASRIQIRFAS